MPSGCVLAFEEVHWRDFGVADLERDLGRFFLFRLLDDEKFSRTEVECARDEVGGKNLAAGVVGHHRIVVSLTRERDLVDRKSTRLNSSHTVISYAVFCLKKKKKKYTETWSEA